MTITVFITKIMELRHREVKEVAQDQKLISDGTTKALSILKESQH